MSQAQETIPIATYVRGLWQKPDLTDLSLRLSNGTFLKVHKFVVCQCDFFRAACTGGFKEALENTIEFPEDNYEAIEVFVKYLYGYNVNEVLSVNDSDGRSVLQMRRLLMLHDTAEKYGMPRLASLTLSEFESVCSHSTSGLHLKVHSNWWSFMANDIYNNAGDHDRTLWRQAFLRLTWAQSNLLIQNEDLLKRTLTDVPEFAVDLVLQGGLDGKGPKKT